MPMSTKRRVIAKASLVLALATGLSAWSAASLAQPNSGAVAPVKVISPHAVTQTRHGHTEYGLPIVRVSVTHGVFYGDLDLSSQLGAEALRARVADTARHACDDLDRSAAAAVYNPPVPSSTTCFASAVQSADAQVDAAIAAARK